MVGLKALRQVGLKALGPAQSRQSLQHFAQDKLRRRSGRSQSQVVAQGRRGISELLNLSKK